MIDFIGEDTRKKLDFNTDNSYGDLVLLVKETRVSGKNYPTCWEYIRGFIELFLVHHDTDKHRK